MLLIVPVAVVISSSVFRSSLVIKGIRFKFVPLVNARIPSHRANVDHSITELNERAALPRKLGIRNILEAEIHQILIFILSKPLDEAIAIERFSQTVCRQAVLGKAEIKEGGDWNRGCP